MIKRKEKNKALRILIFNVNWLGDVLFSTPAIRLIRKTYPDAFLSCIVPSSCREILEDNPHINEIIIYDDKGKERGFWAKLKFVNLLRSKKFDKAFLFHRSTTRALIAFFAGIPQRVGYTSRKRFYLLTDAIKYPTQSLHRADYYLNIVREHENYQMDISFKLDFFISTDTQRSLEILLRNNDIEKNDFVVVLNPGGNWSQKRWPKEKFSVLAAVLIRDYKAKVVLSGAAKDRELANEIKNLSGMDLINLCGKTSLKQLAALMQRANLVVSSDSGPLHVASSVGAKVIGIFGPTSILITGPYKSKNSRSLKKDVGCVVPCYKQGCMDLRCLKAVAVEDVEQEIKKIL